MPESPTPFAHAHNRYETLLRQEEDACEDPICCCEAEPRWLRLQHYHSRSPGPSEWEVIERPPSDEL